MSGLVPVDDDDLPAGSPATSRTRSTKAAELDTSGELKPHGGLLVFECRERGDEEADTDLSLDPVVDQIDHLDMKALPFWPACSLMAARSIVW
jgi:hypothetical protein